MMSDKLIKVQAGHWHSNMKDNALLFKEAYQSQSVAMKLIHVL